MKKNNRKGFTIVELVIVIAVIAILAAVMIPTFAGVIDNANRSAALQEAQNAIRILATELAEEGESVSSATIYIFETDIAENTNPTQATVAYTVPYNGSIGEPSDTATTFSYGTSSTSYASVVVTEGDTPKTTALAGLGKNIIIVVPATN